MTLRLVRRPRRVLHMVKDQTSKGITAACGAEIDMWTEEVTVWSSDLANPPPGFRACAECSELHGVTG